MQFIDLSIPITNDVVSDPPYATVFRRDRDGRIFRIERDATALAQAAAQVLQPGGRLLFSSNSRGFAPGALARLLRGALPQCRHFETSPMPPDFTGEQYLQAVWAR